MMMKIGRTIKTNWDRMIALAMILLLSACSSLKNNHLQQHLAKSNCNQLQGIIYGADQIPPPLYQIKMDTVLNRLFSQRSLNVAHAIGLIDMLSVYVNNSVARGEEEHVEKRLQRLELSHAIYRKINTASLEVSAIASEMDCEEERAGQVADYLSNKEADAESKLTTAAIVTGAAGAIISGIILANGSESNADQYIGIATGIAEASLALAILRNKQKVVFYHPRNALKDIWEGNPTSEIFPASIWYYLNYYNPANAAAPSLRYQIIDKWMSFGQISAAKTRKKKHLIDLYFGKGGQYTTSQLDNRANMLDQLESYINLMKQDLKELAIELEQLNQLKS